MTFSIMATDPDSNQIGYAVASKTYYVGMIAFIKPAVGTILCLGARAPQGKILTTLFCIVTYNDQYFHTLYIPLTCNEAQKVEGVPQQTHLIVFGTQQCITINEVSKP
jgi:hypothetical protein